MLRVFVLLTNSSCGHPIPALSETRADRHTWTKAHRITADFYLRQVWSHLSFWGEPEVHRSWNDTSCSKCYTFTQEVMELCVYTHRFFSFPKKLWKQRTKEGKVRKFQIFESGAVKQNVWLIIIYFELFITSIRQPESLTAVWAKSLDESKHNMIKIVVQYLTQHWSVQRRTAVLLSP